MSLTTGEMSAADLAAVVGNKNDGFGFGTDGGWWIILLFLVLFGNGGWGNGFGGNGGTNGLYPWMNQAEITNNGFRDQMLNDNITSIQNGITGISTQLCNGFNEVQVSNLNAAFGLQNAINAGFNGTQAQLAQCCCDNRLASADLKYTIATENCADRAALSDGVRDIIASNTANTQAILDKLCQQEIDAKNDTIAQLRQQLNMATLRESQVAQTAEIRSAQATTANQLVTELRSCPIPSQPVYGNQPIFTCGGNNGCSGCGCGM